MVKIEIEIPEKMKEDINRIKPKQLSLKKYIKIIILNEINSRLNDLRLDDLFKP